jgi:hypothetical protein
MVTENFEGQETMSENFLAEQVQDAVDTRFDELRVMKRLDALIEAIPNEKARRRILGWLADKYAPAFDS